MNAIRTFPLLRKNSLSAGVRKAYYLHDGLKGGTFPKLYRTPGLVTSGSSTTVSTNGTDALPSDVVAGGVIYVRSGNPNRIVGDVPTPTRWEARTIRTRTDDYNLEVDEAIEIAALTDGFGYRALFAGDGDNDGWLGTGGYRQREIDVQVHSGGPVDVEVEVKNENGEVVKLEAFTVSDAVAKTYEGGFDWIRVWFTPAADAVVSSSLVNRRF